MDQEGSLTPDQEGKGEDIQESALNRERPIAMLSADAWLGAELESYEKGRRKLAAIMGANPENFSEKEVQGALRYLLPTRLTADDARPQLKVQSCLF